MRERERERERESDTKALSVAKVDRIAIAVVRFCSCILYYFCRYTGVFAPETIHVLPAHTTYVSFAVSAMENVMRLALISFLEDYIRERNCFKFALGGSVLASKGHASSSPEEWRLSLSLCPSVSFWERTSTCLLSSDHGEYFLLSLTSFCQRISVFSGRESRFSLREKTIFFHSISFADRRLFSFILSLYLCVDSETESLSQSCIRRKNFHSERSTTSLNSGRRESRSLCLSLPLFCRGVVVRTVEVWACLESKISVHDNCFLG